jgi:hypothetical protein
MSDIYKHKAKKYKYKYLKLKQEIKGGSLFKNEEEIKKIKNFLKFLKDFLDNNITRIFNKNFVIGKRGINKIIEMLEKNNDVNNTNRIKDNETLEITIQETVNKYIININNYDKIKTLVGNNYYYYSPILKCFFDLNRFATIDKDETNYLKLKRHFNSTKCNFNEIFKNLQNKEYEILDIKNLYRDYIKKIAKNIDIYIIIKEINNIFFVKSFHKYYPKLKDKKYEDINKIVKTLYIDSKKNMINHPNELSLIIENIINLINTFIPK